MADVNDLASFVNRAGFAWRNLLGIDDSIIVDASGRVLIRQTAAVVSGSGLIGANLQMNGTTAAGSFAQLGRFSDDIGGPAVQLLKSRGTTVGSYTVVSVGDRLGTVQFYGADGVDAALGAEIFAASDSTAGSGDMGTRLILATSPDGAEGSVEGIRLDRNQCVGIGNTDPSASAKLAVNHSEASQNVAHITNTNNAQTGSTDLVLDSYTAASTNYFFGIFRSDADGTPDSEFVLRGDGNAFADGAFTDSGADYQEYLESLDGSALPVGASVVFQGDKVRVATTADVADDVIGVVRPKEDNKNSAVIGNAAWNHWTDKYLTDEFGRYLTEEYEAYEWEETDKDGKKSTKTAASYKLKGVKVPKDAKVTKRTKRKLNPAWNEADVYIPRHDRPEWNLIGMLGQIQISKGQKTNPRWRKMKDISANVELWFVR